MPTIKFTARTIESLRPSDQVQVDYWDESLAGFGLRVTRSGIKTWLVRYRLNGRRRRFKIGTYPITGLAEARDAAKHALHGIAQGYDPAANRTQDRMADSFSDLAHEYLERHAKPNKRSWREDERILNKDVLPKWKGLKAKDVTRKDVLKLLDDTVSRGAPVHANRVLALIRKIFNFGIQRDIVVMNPCQAVSRPTKEYSRERVLSQEEIKKVWQGLDSEEVLTSAIFKLYILTGQRGSEIRSMSWDDLDLQTNWWTIPGEKTKNSLAHRVPLSEQALDVIRSISFTKETSHWVFPSPIDKSKHVDNIQKAIQRIRKKANVSFVGHDFRRTAASHMAAQGIQRLVVSKIINHVEQGVTKVYERYSYDQEKRAALDSWGSFIQKILADDRLSSSIGVLRSEKVIAETSLNVEEAV